ncbi:oxygenase MpaB family protein [Streptomyces sp. SP18CS02]|uniref:oxygenase MpaB family protein n=1 Tax=Streptomyces sp. SP18CS02 TaxID=3002531 RepID=UPI002E77BEC1|nr:oxygenase MpaB family protein [Streptomyces sp. SP18CS02]MEE1753213.1 oxygenase MpaB family protein [Streptomyces sp. SP18CS02]
MGNSHAAADPGLFGPDSVTWQLHGDPMMWVAGVRALYLQALHPGAVRGVMINSDFMKDAWGRLMRTASFVGTISYGTTEAAEKAGARVRRIHRLLGVDDPELLLWVHCAEVDSYLDVVRRSGIVVGDAQADRYIDEHREAARLVGLDPARVPATGAALAAYFDRMLPGLTAGDDARTVDAFLRRPPVPAPLVPARALVWRHVAALAYDSLPSYAHRLYGRPAPDPATVTRRLIVTGNTLRCVPSRIRWRLPPQHILKAMARLGPDTRPAPYKLRRQGAILDGPGRAWRIDGGDSARWGKPG